jgi:pre-rRNA-processing protein TSR4
MVFVCQLYAPTEEVNPDAFHRSLYVFACPSTSCVHETTGSVRVLRVQLPRENPYYPEEKDELWAMHLPESWDVHLCKVCGQRGRGKCPVQGEYFCGKHHQKEHKEYVFDKLEQLSKQLDVHFLPSVMTASELVVEEEPFGEKDEKSRLKAENTLFKSQGGDVEDEDGEDEDEKLEQKDLNEMYGAADETVTKDSVTMNFYDRINRTSDVKTQCLRYLRWPDQELCSISNMPLWIRSDYQPNTIPECQKCGAERKFEFQIMPQMLHYLLKDLEMEQAKEAVDTKIKKEDIEALKTASSIMEQAPPEQVPPDFAANKQKAVEALRNKLMKEDGKRPSWGVIAVYTCTSSCGGMEVDENSELAAYIEEYAWKQPSLD